MNNCYTIIYYKFNIKESDIVKDDWTIEHYTQKLKNFLACFYYENESLFKLKPALMTLAVNEIPTTKMLFLIGEGGDGKSMDAILERNV